MINIVKVHERATQISQKQGNAGHNRHGGDEKRAIIRQSGRKLMTQISEPEDRLEQKKTEGNFI